MRPGQQNKRGRGRGNNGSGGSGGGGGGGGNNNNNFNRKGSNPLTRTYDSSGPDVKIRGTAQHIAEKYSTLARDSHSSSGWMISLPDLPASLNALYNPKQKCANN